MHVYIVYEIPAVSSSSRNIILHLIHVYMLHVSITWFIKCDWETISFLKLEIILIVWVKKYIINMCLKIFFLLFIGFGNHLSQYWRKVKTKHFVIWKFSWLITFLYSNSVVIYPGVGRVVKATAVWRTRRACRTPTESPSGTCGTFGQWILIFFLSLYYV